MTGKEAQSMRILIMGAGGLGGYFGGLLAQSGADVTFIARGANLQALQTRGLTVRSVHGDFALHVPVCTDPAGLPPADCVLFCVKTYDVAAAAALLQPVVTAQTVLLTLQNGVDTPAELRAAFGRGTVLAGITRIGSTLLEPGVIEQSTLDRAIEFGSLDGQAQPQVEAVRRLLAGGDIPAVVSSDIQKSLWEKLIFISAFSGLSTLTRLRVAEVLACEPTRALYRTVMQETAAVASAAGINVAPDIVERTMHYLDTSGDPGASSMAVDFQQRRRLEVEAIHGAVVRHGQRQQVPTPVNATIYGALVVMDQYNRQTPSTRAR
jgi:2-dehydropantoate 2-reductase